MKRKDLKNKLRVIDRWYRYWGIGTIVRIKKTRTHILFSGSGERISYDDAHLQLIPCLKSW